MRSRRVWVVAAVVFLAAVSPVVAATIHFRDGGVHDIDYEISDFVAVDSRSPGRGTTVNILEGGGVLPPWRLTGFEDSIINILGGRTNLNAYDNSMVNIAGGSMETVGAWDSSRVNVSGGTITVGLTGGHDSRIAVSGGSVTVLVASYSNRTTILDGSSLDIVMPTNHSQVDIFGGYVDDVWADDDSVVGVSGGSVNRLKTESNSQATVSEEASVKSVLSHDDSKVSIYGGSIKNVSSLDSSRLSIFGGSIGWLNISDSGQVSIAGGLFGEELRIERNAVLTLDGSDFAVDGTDVGYSEIVSILGLTPYDEPYRRLTGTLLNGDPFDNEFRIGQNGRIVLVPEPGTVLLVGVGWMVLLRKRKRA